MHVAPGEDEAELVAALPVAVDPDTVTAKFHRKERKLSRRRTRRGGGGRGDPSDAGTSLPRTRRRRVPRGVSDERR